MLHTFISLFFISTSILFSKNSVTHIAQLAIKSHEQQSICLNLTSDHKNVITKTPNGIDIWESSTLKHLTNIKDVPHGWKCTLHQNDHYYLIQDMKALYLYDLVKKKKINTYTLPDAKKGDNIMSASFSKDGKHINVFQYTQMNFRERQPTLYRYEIQSGKRTKVKSLIIQSAGNQLKDDTLYTFDSIQNKLFLYDIEKDKRTEGDETDKKTYESLRGWWDCSKKQPYTKICAINGQIKYSLASGNLSRTDLESKEKITPKITFIQKRPLRKSYFYEAEFQMPYAVTKRTQQYQGWDLAKGKLNWSLQQRTSISTEFDSVPSEGIFFIPEEKRALVIGGFEDQIYNFDLQSGLFSYLPKDKNVSVYHSFALDDTHDIYSITYTYQKPPYPLKTNYYERKTGKHLPNYDTSDFHVDKNINRTHSISWGDGTFDLYRKSDRKLLAAFTLFENDEWLVMTPEGYFNASSVKVTVNILKEKQEEITIDAIDQLKKKWYRPDIVEAILSNRDIESLKKKTYPDTLPDKKEKNNLFQRSIFTQVAMNREYELLKKLYKSKNRADIPYIHEGIQKADSAEALKAYYRLLSHYRFRYSKKFIESRISTLGKHPQEQLYLVQYLYHKRDRKKKLHYLSKIIQENNLKDETQAYLVKKMKAEKFELYEKMLWDTAERLHVLPEKVHTFLKQKDPKRAEKAFNTYQKYLERKAKETIRQSYTRLLKTEQFTKERNHLDQEIYRAFKQLNDLNISSDIFIEKKIASARLDSFLKDTTFKTYSFDAYLHFLMRQSSDIGKKILHTKIEIYTLTYYQKKGKNSYSLFDLLNTYADYRPEFVINTLIDLALHAPKVTQRHILYSMRHMKDPRFVPALLSKLDFKDSMTSDYALQTLLQYDEEVIKKTITEINKLDDCSKILYPDITNSVIAKKVSKEIFARYKCGMKTD